MNNNETVAVSISVPVYNAEKYLRNCLDCLVNQTLQDIEIIVVNDGSTDGSEAIIREYAQKDSRIVLISKENGGLASARQAAIEVAKGKYFCACDADDWVEKDMYEKLYNKSEEMGADIVMCDYWSEYAEGRQTSCKYAYELNSRKDLVDDALNGRFPCMVWNKLYRRELFEKYSLSWEPGINMGEDFLMSLKILQHPVKIKYLSNNLYHYRRMPGEDSYTNKVTINSYNQMVRIQEWIERNFDKNKYRRGITHYLINIAFAGLRVEEGMTTEHYKQTATRRLSIGDLLKEHTLKAMVILWTKLFGYRAGRVIYKSMYKKIYQ